MRSKFIFTAVCILIFIFILSIFIHYKKSGRNAIEIFIANKKMINILIAGSNVYNNNKHVFYAIASINPENDKIGITFIPPDFRVDLDGNGKNYIKISQIDINDFKDLSASFERDLKIQIPFYVVLYSPDVERIVDLLEGINLYMLDDINIPGIHFGINYLDGDKTVQYINTVEENSIYKKYDRIQDILLTLYYNKENYEKYADIEFIAKYLRSIKTNLLAQEVVSLAKLLYKKDSDLICTMMHGFLNQEGFYVIDDIAYKTYKNDFMKKLVIDNDLVEQQIKIKVLNGTDIAGLAKKVRHKLVSEGFNVMEFGTASYPAFENTVIINRKGEIAPVRKVAGLLGVSNIYHIVDSTQLINMQVIVGKDMAK